MAEELNYKTIENPYDSFLNRQEIIPLTQQSSNGNVEEMPVKSEGALNDVWIRNFIRSENWSPKSKGFYINGLTGYAEFSNVFVSGDIQALTGTIGGFTIGATNLLATSGGNTTILSSGATAFSSGPTGSPTVTITQAGLLSASNISVTGGSISGTTITGGTIQTATSGLRLVMSGANNAYEFRSDSTLLSELVSMTIPDSGLSGAALVHGTGEIMLGISGQGLGGGGRSIVMQSADGLKYFGFFDYDTSPIKTFGIECTVPMTVTSISATGSISGSNLSGTNTGDSSGHSGLAALSGASFTGATETNGTNAHLSVSGNAFLRAKSMTGAVATGLTGAQNGAIYYKSDTNELRAYINGAFRTLSWT